MSSMNWTARVLASATMCTALISGFLVVPGFAQVVSASRLDLTAATFPDDVLRVYAPGQTLGVSTPVVHMNGGGGLFSSAYQILGAAMPTLEEVEADWSDVYAPAMVVRPAPSTSSTNIASMDAAGNYNFTLKPDGSLAWAGPGAGNRYAEVNWDTVLKRVSQGQLRVLGSISASRLIDTPIVAKFTNDTLSDILAGTVVKIDPTKDEAFIPTESAMDPTVLAGCGKTRLATPIAIRCV